MNIYYPRLLFASIMTVLFLSIISPCQAEQEASYFPLAPHTHYIYKVTFGEEEFLEETVVTELSKNDFSGCYFLYADPAKLNSTFLSATMFGLGGYTLEGNTLYTFFAIQDVVKGLEILSQKLKLLTFPLTVGATSEVKAPFAEAKFIFTVESIEDIWVPIGHKTNCAKIKKEIITADGSKEEFIWLAPGIGMIKWQRSTGRTDELVLVKFPKPEINQQIP